MKRRQLILSGLGVFVLMAGMLAAIFLVKNTQIFRQKAATGIANLSTTQPSVTQVNGLNRIGVRAASNGSEFYDTVTGAMFIPIGNNYTRVENLTTPFSPNSTIVVHSLFIPGQYNSSQVDTALTQMQSYGYNVIRVFLDGAEDENPSGSGLNQSYMQNVADFIIRATNHNIYTILDISLLPESSEYYPAPPANMQGYNWHFLSPAALQSKEQYVKDIINSLKSFNTPLSSIFAYSLQNEQYYDSSLPPLSLSSGVVTTIAGNFDISTQVNKNQMMDANLVQWINQTRMVIKDSTFDPNALVTLSFVPQSGYTGVGNTTVISRPKFAFANPSQGGSSADFISLSLYPAWGVSMVNLMSSLQIPSGVTKPIIMFEEGILHSQITDAASAVSTIKNWEASTCQYQIKGWLIWTWDTVEQENHRWWTAIDSNNALAQGRAPSSNPIPCGLISSPSPTPTATPTPTPTSTPAPAISNFRIKLQGLSVQGGSDSFTIDFKKGISTVYSFNVSATSDSTGTYSATVPLADNVNPDIYDIYIKDSTHLRKKFVAVNLVSGVNNEDFTGTPLIAGDFNNDNVFDITDLGGILTQYTQLEVPVTAANQMYDINGDGKIDIQDIGPLLSNYIQLENYGD